MARTRRATATPETATTTPVMTPEDIQKAIADGVNAVLAERAAANARNSGTSMPNGESVAATHRRCTYKDFMSCQPTFYKGTEGVSELAH